MDNLQELKNMMAVLSDRPTKKEVAEAISTVLEFVKNLRIKDVLSTELSQTKDSMASNVRASLMAEIRLIEKALSDKVGSAQKHGEVKSAEMGDTLRKEMGKSYSALPKMSHVDGLKTSIEQKYTELQKMIRAVEKMCDGGKIVEAINGSEGKISRERIEGLDDELKAIRSLPRGGGGTSALGVRQAFKYIFHTEAPVGAIDGVNKTYTVKNAVWAIISFTLNGESIAELPNYTFANYTITFATALPSDYSGKDFEIKYIG